MKKQETLRGRGSFQSLFRSGRRVDGGVLRCFFRWESGAGTLVRAGFSISAKTYNAARRNRARRLMRTAFDREKEVLAGIAEKTGGALTLVFVYNGGKDAKPGLFNFQQISGDMNRLCLKVSAMTSRDRG